jgi:hypothetical protein
LLCIIAEPDDDQEDAVLSQRSIMACRAMSRLSGELQETKKPAQGEAGFLE